MRSGSGARRSRRCTSPSHGSGLGSSATPRLVAAAVVAGSPPLIAYSQEARAYALYVLLCAVSFMFVALIRERPTPRRYAGWAIASAVAVVAHYFPIFLVVPEALWLLLAARDRRSAGFAVGAWAAVMAGVLPLALYQREHG